MKLPGLLDTLKGVISMKGYGKLLKACYDFKAKNNLTAAELEKELKKIGKMQKKAGEMTDKYPQVINPKNGEVDCLATQLLGQVIDSREREREKLKAMKRQHEAVAEILSKEIEGEVT